MVVIVVNNTCLFGLNRRRVMAITSKFDTYIPYCTRKNSVCGRGENWLDDCFYDIEVICCVFFVCSGSDV